MSGDQIANFRYSLQETDEMVKAIDKPVNFLTAKFFQRQRFFNGSANIEWDIVEGTGRRLAPFVSPMSLGVPVKEQGSAIGTIAPPYIKLLNVVNPAQSHSRTPGEPYGGNKTFQQRLDEKVAELLLEHRTQIDNRLEWMAGKILSTGQVTCAGPEYPSQLVDFGQASALRVPLDSSDEWDHADGDPLGDIEDMWSTVRDKSYGASATTVVMEGTAFKLFRAKMKSQSIMFDATIRLTDQGTRIDATPRANADGELMGTIGKYSFWTYDGAYEAENGTLAKHLPSYTAIQIDPVAFEGTQYFAGIMDMDANMQAMKHFSKTWPSKNPSGMSVLTQSAPILGPRRRNAWAVFTVKTP